MSLDYAILGFLNQQPLTGYDLKKIIDTSIRHFWPADQAQIYRTLARLTEHGLTDVAVVEQTDRPDRKVYHITDAGRTALQTWLRTPVPFGENRSAPMIQVFFSGQLADEEVLAMLERVAGEMRAGLAQYEQIPQQIEAYAHFVQSPREFYFWMLTLDIGIHTLRANLAWIEDRMTRIRAGEIPSGQGGKP